MVAFAGWEMPIQFEGIFAETRVVRNASGLFDVSHMGRIRITGNEAASLLNWIVTANVPALKINQARYTLICTKSGFVLDDGIVYRLDQEEYLLICNAANRHQVWQCLTSWSIRQFRNTKLEDCTLEMSMIAFQGPNTPKVMDNLAPNITDKLKPFHCTSSQIGGIPALVARTGYTGEEGFEIMPSAKDASKLWEILEKSGAAPCGLGARDVLRLEAGLLLHGTDMDKYCSPFEAGLDRFVYLNKQSVASTALSQIAAEGVSKKLVGFQLLERGIPRHGYPIYKNAIKIGEVTSGGYSPTLDRYIGLGYVAVEFAVPGCEFTIDIRGKNVKAKGVTIPFYSRRRADVSQ